MKYWRKITLYSVLLNALISASWQAQAQFPPSQPQFVSVGDARQIPENVVSSLAQGSNGFIWVGAAAGLVRYDGYRFKLYIHDEDDPQSLGGNFVRALVARKDGSIWVGTEPGGLSIYRPQTDSFERPFSNADIEVAPQLASVSAIAEADNGDMWLGTGNGLVRMLADGSYRLYPGFSRGLLHGDIRSLVTDNAGRLWVGSRGGLNLYRPGSDDFIAVPYPDDSSGDSLFVRTLYKDSLGKLWIGTEYNGALRLDPDTKAFTPMLEGIDSQLNSAPIYAFREISDNEIWVARIGGIDRANFDNGQWISREIHDPSNPFSLANSDIRDILKDQSGLIWVAGFGGGLQRKLDDSRGLHMFRHSLIVPNSLSDPNISSTLALQDGTLWLGTRGNGIDVFKPEQGVIDHYHPDAGKDGQLAGGWITAMVQRPQGDIWVGANPGLLYRYRQSEQIFELYDQDKGFQNANIRCLWVSRNGDVWIGTNRGLQKWSAAEDRISKYGMAIGSPMEDGINALHEDNRGTLWVATGATGLYRLDAGARGLVQVDGQSDSGQPLPTMSIVGMLGADDFLWLDTTEGLHKVQFDEKGDATAVNISRKFKLNGRPMGANLLQDSRGRIWTPQHVYDPANNTMTPLQQADGVALGTNWYRSHSQTQDGIMLFGGSSGLLFVEPDKFEPWRRQPKIVLTDLRIDGAFHPLQDNEKLVVIEAGNKSISIEFAAQEYSAPERVKYQYRLDGFDDDWISTDAERRVASYSNLWPGDYRFRLKATNRLGQWNEQEFGLMLRVMPQYWQTSWFLGILLIVAVVSIITLIKIRTRIIAKRADQLASLVSERTEELQQTQQSLIEQEKMASLGNLVAGIAHEINTPIGIAVTAASTMDTATQQLLNKVANNKLTKSSLQTYASNVTESNRLILGSLERAKNLISSFKQLAVDQSSEQRREIQVHDFLQEVSYALEPLYRKGKHKFVWSCPVGIEMNTYPGALFQIFSNLISNSVMHGFDIHPPGEMSLEVTQGTDLITFVYKDNGKGMGQETLNKIFEPFFTTKRGEGGSGLGMHLVYNLTTQLLGGQIDIQSAEGKGFSCTLRLPRSAPMTQ
ncbi:two-component regulator propeller domain-containing protein [Aliiglaciecola sp. CAU 1673]|uniref:sensor histidine kinase n=1 Tax=Aliiglaciecola sp. CAU 1673 TaxID=3032595 RepID=UPI0023DAEF51|nr:sensor histidine kinase [Aliiglaciecola sp. CAU 1673]MDF2176819.1 two-component regulator propeller domain-containing protein [Aliiglaciecola sp. CAU 1673]